MAMSETSEHGTLSALNRALMWTLRSIAVVLVLGMLVVVCGAVVLRAFGIVVFGADELTRLMLSWTVAVGVALAAEDRGHLAVEAVVTGCPAPPAASCRRWPAPCRWHSWCS